MKIFFEFINYLRNIGHILILSNDYIYNDRCIVFKYLTINESSTRLLKYPMCLHVNTYNLIVLK